jgi:hypothetical protein
MLIKLQFGSIKILIDLKERNKEGKLKQKPKHPYLGSNQDLHALNIYV